MTMNLRCDMTFVQDDGWYAASNRYDDFIRRHEGLHIFFGAWRGAIRRLLLSILFSFPYTENVLRAEDVWMLKARKKYFP